MSWLLKSLLALIIIANCYLPNGISAGESPATDEDLSVMLDTVAKKISSYPALKNWTASVVTAQTEMDKTWKPKKITRVFKVVRVVGGRRSEEIVRAEEIEKDKTKDITQKYIREVEERRQEQEKREAERRKEPRAEDGSRQSRRSFNLDNFLPFNEKNRGKYVFSLIEDEMLDGKPIFVLQSRAKVRTEELWEGQYYISQGSYDLLKAILRPAKNPKFVKEFVAEIEFQELPSGHFVLKKSKMKVDGGIALKHIRMIIEEEYSNYEIVEGGTVVSAERESEV